jgi:hypothetical protein
LYFSEKERKKKKKSSLEGFMESHELSFSLTAPVIFAGLRAERFYWCQKAKLRRKRENVIKLSFFWLPLLAAAVAWGERKKERKQIRFLER